MKKPYGKNKFQRQVEPKNQAKYSRKVLLKLYGNEKLRKIQRKLYAYCANADLINLNSKKSHMIVIKEASGRFKGEKVINPSEIKEVEASGGKFRHITFLKDSHFHDVSREISRIIDIGLPNQHGFRQGKSVFNAANQVLDVQDSEQVRGAVNIDLKNAFNAVPKEAVYQIFRRVFDLNHKMAEKLAEAATYQGFMYQGCPFAPQIYNIWVIGAIHSIEAMGFQVVAYADDLTVLSTERRITFKEVLAIKKRIQFWNFSINTRKVRYFNPTEDKQLDTVGVKIELQNQCAEALTYRRQLKKLYMFCDLYLRKNKRFTHRYNKNGEFIELVGLINGLYGWLDEGGKRYFGKRKFRKLWVKVRAKVLLIRKIERHERLKARQRNKLLKTFYLDNPKTSYSYSITRSKPFDNWEFKELLRFSLGEITNFEKINYFLTPNATFCYILEKNLL